MSFSARSVLVFGGARSGKSRYAQMLAETSGLTPVMIATAQAFDGEMEDRIARHQNERGAEWLLAEEPVELAHALAQAAAPGRILLVDCATLWLSNLMLGERDIAAATHGLLDALRGTAAPVIFVSNEVGAGIVPENALARRFRDAQGRLNQQLAAACDVVVLVGAGLPLQLKPAAAPQLRF